jgi:hypothetical protein
MTNRDAYPLKKVIDKVWSLDGLNDYLECGHIVMTSEDVDYEKVDKGVRGRRCIKCWKGRRIDFIPSKHVVKSVAVN